MSRSIVEAEGVSGLIVPQAPNPRARAPVLQSTSLLTYSTAVEAESQIRQEQDLVSVPHHFVHLRLRLHHPSRFFIRSFSLVVATDLPALKLCCSGRQGHERDATAVVPNELCNFHRLPAATAPRVHRAVTALLSRRVFSSSSCSYRLP